MSSRPGKSRSFAMKPLSDIPSSLSATLISAILGARS